ncbi:integrase [Haloferula luteola]|uniref:Integrase n=1 Tax=Haloferula luteola TaxID=595692 RepID=A0A840V9E9_9BACT|nr:DUF6538 domain-containing protein [Haloferula luteola]MBB5353696.1 integrase [Haloferula luteola]
MTKNYIRRGKRYYYLRRVPKQLAEFDRRSHVRIALGTADEREAMRKAAVYDDFIERYWGELVRRGSQDHDSQLFQQARELARAYGFAYKNLAEVVDSPLEELLARVEAVAGAPPSARGALLGTVPKSSVKLSQVIDRFWPLCEDRFTGKNERQITKYKNPRNAALNNFIAAVGNVDLVAVNRVHVLTFRKWLMERIGSGKIQGHTANRQLRHVKDMLHTVGLEAQVDTDFRMIFADTRFQSEKDSRPPFEADFVQHTILAAGALDGLNETARLLVHLMIETGARESELIGLDEEEDILLQGEIPYLWIRKNKHRGLKTHTSERKIPLVGVALTAAKTVVATGGFTRYRENPDAASATINKYFRENGLRPTPRHTLYSLRHTFKDRLRDAEAPEEIIDELMGHKKPGPRYGRGRKLDQKRDWLERIAFRHPGEV